MDTKPTVHRRTQLNSTQLEWASFQTGDHWQRTALGIFPRRHHVFGLLTITDFIATRGDLLRLFLSWLSFFCRHYYWWIGYYKHNHKQHRLDRRQMFAYLLKWKTGSVELSWICRCEQGSRSMCRLLGLTLVKCCVSSQIQLAFGCTIK